MENSIPFSRSALIVSFIIIALFVWIGSIIEVNVKLINRKEPDTVYVHAQVVNLSRNDTIYIITLEK